MLTASKQMKVFTKNQERKGGVAGSGNPKDFRRP